MLEQGMRGDAVAALQRHLRTLGYDLGPAGVDGVFGNHTAQAVRQFQQQHGLTVDGVVGPRTLAALAVALAQAAGEPVGPPHGLAQIRAVFGDIQLKMGPNPNEACYLRIEGDWAAHNLVTMEVADLPAIRRIYCHHRIVPVLREVFAETAASGRRTRFTASTGASVRATSAAPRVPCPACTAGALRWTSTRRPIGRARPATCLGRWWPSFAVTGSSGAAIGRAATGTRCTSSTAPATDTRSDTGEEREEMRRDLLAPENLWQVILLQLVGELARNSADKVAARYTADGVKRVKAAGVSKPRDVVRAALNMIEEKQGWSNSLVKMALFLRGTTRSKEKAKFAEAVLARVEEKQLTDPADIVAETVAVVREKQGWDELQT
jgi:hypothetical protein